MRRAKPADVVQSPGSVAPQRLQAMIDHAPDAICLIDKNGIFVYASPAIKNTFGYDAESLVGTNALTLVHPQDRPQMAQRLQARIEQPGPRGIGQCRFKHADGSYRYIEASAINRLEDENTGTLVCWIRDITEFRETLATLRERERRMIGVFSAVAEGIITTADTGVIEDFNASAERIFGYARQDVIGKRIKHLVPDIWDDIYEDFVRDINALGDGGSGAPPAREIEGLHADGSEITLELSGGWFEHLGRSFFTVIVRDISDKKQSDEALRLSEERFALAAEAASDGLWDWNVLDNTVYFGPRWEKLLELDPGTLDDRIETWFNRLYEADFAQFTTAFDIVLAGEVTTLEVEHRMLCGDEQYRWFLTRGLGVQDEQGRVNRIVGSVSDIHGRRVAEDRAAHNALHDALTELPNRQLLIDRVDQLYQRREFDPSKLNGLIVIDLDRFRVVNESLRHRIGDQILVTVARRLESAVRRGDTVARLGSDQFGVLISEGGDKTAMQKRAEDLQDALRATITVGGDSADLTASVGLRLVDNETLAPEDLLRDALLASQEAKRLGGDQIVPFFLELRTSALQTFQFENDLRAAIRDGRVEAFYQPLVDIETGRPIWFEALARLNHPSRGIIPPSEFIPIAEETGLIAELADRVLEQATEQLAAWKERFPGLDPLAVTVNLSPVQFDRQDVVGQLRRAIAKTGLNGNDLKVEVTESLLMQNPERSSQILRHIQALGVKICVDDFGTGYSSLSYLRQFSFDTLKIDRSFVSRIVSDNRDAELVRTMIQLGQNVGMSVVAEDVETQSQLDVLCRFGCHFAQGYLLAKPLPANDATDWLKAQAESPASA